MQEEKFNDNWRHRLEDVESLPHALLQDKEAAWEKLQSRLDEKPGRKIVAWYWLAAACVLFAFLIPVFMTTKHVNVAVTPQQKQPLQENSMVQQETPVIPSTPGIINAPRQTTRLTNEKKNELLTNMVIDSTAATPVITANEKTVYNIAVSPALTDSNSIATVKITKQKKLKVVHINELGEPVEVPMDFARSADLHLFQLKLAQQEIYNGSSVATNEPSMISITIKHSSN